MNELGRKIIRSYVDASKSYAQYWRLYGGFGSLLASPYMHFALVLSALLFNSWSTPGWWETVLNILPNVLGFSLGGYAIWLAIGDARFRSLLAGSNDRTNVSPFLQLNASFVHFIITQFLAIGIALLANAMLSAKSFGWIELAFSWIGYFLFLYALLSALAATMHIFKVATWYDRFLETNKRKE